MAIGKIIPTFVLGAALVFGPVPAWSQEQNENNSSSVRSQTESKSVPITAEKPANSHNSQVVIDRFPNGKPEIRREIALDQQENFVSHGEYTVYSADGHVVGGGQYHLGKRTGEWNRSHDASAPVVRENAAPGFGGPFTSTATFLNDKLHGDWAITDAQKRPVVLWQFSHGQRHGQWLWFNTDGTTRKQVQFKDDQIDGDIVASDGKDKLKVLVAYVEGRELSKHLARFSPRQVKSEGFLLKPLEVTSADIDWWNGKLEAKVVNRKGELDRHGEWKFYHANGKLRMHGTYDRGKETGRFVWHHENGQKSSEGYYYNGKKQGRWEMWYASGGRKTAGQCVDGEHDGVWMSWHENGMPKLQAQYGDGRIVQAKTWDEHGTRVENIASRNEDDVEDTRLSSKPTDIENKETVSFQ